MRNRPAAFLIILLVTSFGFDGQASERKADAGVKLLNLAQAQADFDLLSSALEEAHAGFHRYATKDEMARSLAAARAKLADLTKFNGSLTQLELNSVIATAIARIRCGHTWYALDGDTEAIKSSARKFPLRVLMERTHPRVMFNDAPADPTLRPGMEILEINGRPIKGIIDRILPNLPADGDSESGRWNNLQGGFADHYWMYVGQEDEFTVKARDAEGATVTTVLQGVTDAAREANQNPVNAGMKAGIGKIVWSRENLSFRFLKGTEIAEIRIRSFSGDDYSKWLEDTFRTLREKGTRTLVIDLRGNGGGKDEYGALLVSHLVDQPFRYFDHIDATTITPTFQEHTNWDASEKNLEFLRAGMTLNPAGGLSVTPKLHSGLMVQQPSKQAFLGKVFVLTDGGTFSTAADFCAVTHHLRRATFIGEETGGAYYGNNSGMGMTLTLPASKQRIRIPIWAYWNATPGYEHARRGTLPDHPVAVEAADVLHGVDKGLDLALKMATSSQPSQTVH